MYAKKKKEGRGRREPKLKEGLYRPVPGHRGRAVFIWQTFPCGLFTLRYVLYVWCVATQQHMLSRWSFSIDKGDYPTRHFLLLHDKAKQTNIIVHTQTLATYRDMICTNITLILRQTSAEAASSHRDRRGVREEQGVRGSLMIIARWGKLIVTNILSHYKHLVRTLYSSHLQMHKVFNSN